jgi:hypothetical protein
VIIGPGGGNGAHGGSVDLRGLANALGEHFIAGFVLYTGQQSVPFGDKIRAVPLDALWLLAP